MVKERDICPNQRDVVWALCLIYHKFKIGGVWWYTPALSVWETLR